MLILGVIGGAVVFLRYLAWTDRQGDRTLHELSWFVEALVAAGNFVAAPYTAHAPTSRWVALGLSMVALGLVATLRQVSWRDNLGALVVVPFALLSASLFTTHNEPWALLTGIAVGGMLLTARPLQRPVPCVGYRRYLFVIPLGLAIIVRFYSVAEYSPGFAMHAIGSQTQSIRYYDQLLPAIRHWDLAMVRAYFGGILTEHMGPNSVLEAYGYTIYGISMTTACFMPAILGCITVWLAYCFGRELYDYRLGFVFALLLAFSPWHISISRYGDTEHAVVPLQVLLAFLFVYRASRERRLRHYVLAGVSLGIAWYIYATNQIVPVIAGLYLLYKVVSDRQFLRSEWWKLTLFAIVFAFVSYPQLSPYIQRHRLPVRTGYQFATLQQLPAFAKAPYEQMFVQVNDPWFYKPGGGLGITEAALFVPGLILCINALRSPRCRDVAVLLLAWVVLSFLPAILGPDATFRRLFLTATAALLLASFVICYWIDTLRGGGRPTAGAKVCVALFCLGYVVLNTHIYFDLVRVDESMLHLYDREMARYVKTRLGKEFLYIYVSWSGEIEDHHHAIRLAGYDELAALQEEGLRREDLYRVVAPESIGSALDERRELHGRTRILAREFISSRRWKDVDIREEVGRRFPGAVEELHRDLTGQPSFITWLVE